MKKEQVKKKKRGSRNKQQNAKIPPKEVDTTPKIKSAKGSKSISRKSVPAPARKDNYKKKGDPNSLIKSFRSVSQFFREARMELKKVKWPTRKELMAVTVMVVILVIVVSLYLGILDYGLIKLIKNLVG